ncbi:MAG: arginine deiminase-related protein [Burkholderiaceae bacterium]
MSRTFLMCPPEYFDVAYVINPWMQGNMRNIDNRLAKSQWRRLYDRIQRHARVRLMHPEPSSPDMVFTANAGLAHEKNFLVSRFRHVERQSEEPYFFEWFLEHGYQVSTGPAEVHFEGAGDALFDRGLPVLWLAHGHRSMRDAQSIIATHITALANIEIVSLELVDERFYHLDTCFCPLEGGMLLYFPKAFSAASLASIEARVPEKKRIVCGDEDAEAFACNAVNIGKTLIVNTATRAFIDALHRHGYQVEQTPLSEFIKAGGSAKCLTLDIT